MRIREEQDGTKLRLEIIGSLDSTTAPQLEDVMENSLKGIRHLQIDLSGVKYISSAGLRALLTAHKKMQKIGMMTITGANETVREVFVITGFDRILKLQ